MGPKRLESIVIVADFAIDRFVTPSSEAECNEIIAFINNPPKSLNFMRYIQRRKNIPHYTQLGGPLPNLAQILRARQRNVSGYAIVGDDKTSGKYLNDLRTLGVDINRFTKRPGKSAECIYVFSSPTENYPPIWLPNVSSNVPSKIPEDFLNTHDVLIVSGTKLSLASKALNCFRDLCVYNPGPEIHNLKENSKDQTILNELLGNVNILSTNLEELNYICKLLELSPKDFFNSFNKLDYLITTKGSEGATLRTRTGSSSGCYNLDLSRFEHRTPLEQIVDTIGAGDVFLGTAVDAILRGSSPEDILANATIIAQESLKQKGAYIPRLWETGATSYPGISKIIE